MGAALEAAMLDAHRAGLSVIPLRENKRPGVPSWKQYIDDQPDLILVQEWAKRAEGFAILCGGATRLQVLDFEGRFTEHIPELKDRLGDELAAVFESWLDGYFVATPGGGFHVAVHVEGDDQPGNIKLAADGMQQCMVETRGHGGYVVAAPSNGTTHPSGQPWGQVRGTFSEIAWATAEQWRAICAAISTFDVVAAASETPPEALPPTALPGGVSISTIERGGNSWIENTTKPLMSVVLEHNGWTHVSGNYWARPDKPPREGHSATVNSNDRLCVFTSNAAPVPQSRNNYTETFDSIDVIGCYQLGHLPSPQERVELMRPFAGLPERLPPAATVSSVPGAGLATAGPAPDGGWLPDDFWESREYLSAIRQAAWDAGRCPEAYLGGVMSAYYTIIPGSVRLEALAGGIESPLNYYVAMCGQPGAGKSGAISAGHTLVGVRDSKDPNATHRFGVVPRSGEAFPQIATIPQPKNRDEVPLTPLYRNGFQIVFDEGMALATQNDRGNSTTLSMLCTAWSGLPGSMVGGVLARGEESYPADLVRISMVMGIQFGIGASLFTGSVAAQGFPARLVCFATDRPGSIEQRKRSNVGQLSLPRPRSDPAHPLLLTFPQEVWQEVTLWDDRRQREGVDPLDGHQMLVRMRSAGGFALMDGAAQVDPIHWQLAGELEKHSRYTRARVLAAAHEVDLRRVHSAGRMDAEREKARLNHQIEDRARSVAQFIHGEAPSPVAWRTVRDRMRGDVRKNIESIIAHAVERGWVVIQRDGRKRLLAPGSSRPL
jgi:hypothetical protein